jgi:hypothetical protein
MRELREMLDELCDVNESLTNWEIDFIDGLCHWEGSFSEAQATTLERIHEQRIP